MPWRKTVARREERREREDRDLPPRMRQGSRSAHMLPLAILAASMMTVLGTALAGAWMENRTMILWILVAMGALAALFVVRVARSRKPRSERPEADGIRWEEP